MSDLVLGPVIGRIGGGGELIEYAPNANEFTVELPDGAWVIVAEIDISELSGSFQATPRINGVEVARIRAGSSNTGSYGCSVMARNMTGNVTISAGHSDARITGVLAFPDPE